MPEFERWFLLAYTGYMIISIFALLWVANGKGEVAQKRRQDGLGLLGRRE
jgi:hypothetical protein